MSLQNKGKRHVLLPYRRMMDRLWKATLTLGLIFSIVGWQANAEHVHYIQPPRDNWLFFGAIVTLAFSFFAIAARYLCFVQADPKYLRMVTPFFRLIISYRRVNSVHPANIIHLFPAGELKWSQRRYLEPYFGITAVMLELNSYPLSKSLLRRFLPPMTLLPKSTGMILVVKDWMTLSNEIDSYLTASREKRIRRPSPSLWHERIRKS